MNNMRSEAERAKRAKRAVEEEFDAYQRQQRETNTGRKMEEMQTRMLIAERAKDDALVTVQVDAVCVCVCVYRIGAQSPNLSCHSSKPDKHKVQNQ